MSFRPALLLRLGLPAALVAGSLIVLTGSSGSAAQPRPFHPPFTAHPSAKGEFEPNTVMVKFKPKATTAARRSAVAKVGGSTEDSVVSDFVKVTGKLSAPELLKKVEADPNVELASLNYKRYVSAVPNDTYYNSDQKTYLNTTRVPAAWDLSKSTGNQIVAVLDTGVDAGHPDLVGHLVPGYNATSSTRPNPVDDNGHGTMTLGIIAAGANNGIGVAGVGWNVKAMPVKVMGANGSGYDADIAEGINWAVAHGAKVINMSLGGPGDNSVLHNAVTNAVNKGVVVVVAAGNDGTDVVQYPAAYPDVIAVAATNPGGVKTDFSSYGDWVDVAAPGWNILTTGARSLTPPEFAPYWYCTGTSCSAPIVAGIAALVRNKWPTLTPAQVAQRLEVLARDAGPRGIDPYYGHGIVDAYAALGGRFAPDFPVNPEDNLDQPSRSFPVAVPVAGSKTTSSTISVEGDVDWYQVTSATNRNLKVSVTGPLFSCAFAENFGPRIDVYNSSLLSLGHAVNPYPSTPIDPATGCPQATNLTATVNVSANDTTYIAVRNDNGSRDTRKYTLTVSEEGAGSTPTGTAYPVADVKPNDLSANAVLTTTPIVMFARDVVAASVNPTTVRLLNGRTGSSVGATVAFDAGTRLATLKPTVPLLDNTPYRIVVSGVQGDGGTIAPFTSVFSTVDQTPSAAGSFDATGAYLAANLAWKIPPTGDLDQVIVRRNPISKPPTAATGTLVYAGTGSAVKNTGLLQGVTYTYAAWVKDRGGKTSPIATTQLFGMKTGISTTSTLINYGGSITLRGSTLRIDNKAYAGLPTNLYVRPKNSTKFTLLAALKTSSTGTVSYTYKPAVSSVYMMTFPGNADLMGTRTPDVTVQVAPTISATLAPTAVKLGKTTAISGYIAPAHAGQPLYLQQYGNKVWKSIASVKPISSGKYAFGIRPAVRGQIAYRIWFPGDADHAQAFSANKIVTIS
ncbi:S8 family serine peptidase [Kribbella kalugense]|uniref:Subtilase family protein n=1 Tax=Kribbella kalugense TaxID=2512221 RepID=A0A4R7ZU86_9ACTN|nr:S8 family serine peptidase [Kribbella kalugense]TDW21643.1 subtilase family protein [Kribbella kalugense]